MGIAAFKKVFGAYNMRKLSLIFLVLSMGFFSGCVVVVDDIIPVRGNGHLMNSERYFSSFDKINIRGSAKVRFYESNEYQTVVTVDSNLLEYITIYTSGDTLHIGKKSGNFSFTEYSVDVYCPELTGVSVSGSGSFTGSDTIFTSKFVSSVSGSGKIEGIIECDNFTATITGSGKIAVSGDTRKANIKISGSGDFNGDNFMVKNADVNISGSGYAEVYVTNYLSAEISGSGRIDYWGNPDVNSRISGSGRIKKR